MLHIYKSISFILDQIFQLWRNLKGMRRGILDDQEFLKNNVMLSYDNKADSNLL